MSRLVVLGSGLLARALCHSLAVVVDRPVTVTVLARDVARAAEVADVSAVRAALGGNPVRFAAEALDVADEAALAAVLHRLDPAWVVQCASYQSPWERLTAPSEWTRLLTAAGFGVTAPLQAGLAVRTAAALRRAGSSARLLNACFPDAVNPLLTALGLPVTAGLGNVALVTASLRQALGLRPDDRLRVLAHHVHLHAPRHPADEALAWVDDRQVTGVTEALTRQRRTGRPELNAITGHTAALLLRDLIAGRTVAANLPGPAGLPGGYPVRLDPTGAVTLDLPAGWDRDAAVDWNDRAGRRDGFRLADGRVRFSDAARAALAPWLPEYAAGFPVADLPGVTARLLALREDLRARPGRPA
ncbi:potassium transporter TrkA [Micromonospora sp. NPDC050980]|uniref:potassium transporter TrkA n=1 Tax=Micromonospora sp. NPDC050980 TaxID=3155161 RepID=UPI0033C28A78